MTIFRPQTLQVKFLLGLGTIVFIMGVFFSASMYFHLKSLLDSEVRDRAKLALAQADSVQRYVREDLRPKMFSVLPKDEFVIEAMSSSFISRSVMDRVALEDSEVLYRRVSVNARNPDYEARGLELELLDKFRQSPEQEEWKGYRRIGEDEYFITARPVTFYKKCLHCHGEPEEAPQVLLERYGRERGFGREAGAIDGVDLVGFPVDDAVTQIRDATVGYIGIYGVGMIMFFAVVQVFFNRLVSANLKRLTQVFRDRFGGKDEVKALERMEHSDEIDEMVHGMEELGDHLLSVQQQLRDNAANLERTVAMRTEQLSREAFERKADVTLFVQLIDGLNRSQSRKEMWRYCLPLLARRFDARGAQFTCMLASQNRYAWPEEQEHPSLPENWKDVLVEGEPFLGSRLAFVPVGATSTASEGLLTLWWDHDIIFEDKDHDIMRALGTQLGIAMENLGALDNLLRQKDMLQSIVEGIADPLLLLEGSCSVVVANAAARALAEELGGAGVSELLPVLYARKGEDCPSEALRRRLKSTEEVSVDNRQFVVGFYPVADDSRTVVYVREVTAERRMMARVRQSEKLATVGRFAAGLAHEMNNPLGVIKCYGELLKNGPHGDENRRDADVILKHATQAQNVLRDLLDFARPVKGEEGGEVDLARSVEDTVNVLSVQAKDRNIDVSVEVDPDFSGASVDGQALGQILANLFNNAMHAVVQDGSIRFRVFRDEQGRPSVQVHDSGPGIPTEILDSVFEPFFTTKEVGKGTGLGLAVVYGLLQDMGGSIEVANDGGAVFTIRFNKAQGANQDTVNG